MKAIQITMDEGLLAQLDADEDVRHRGRSAVLRDVAGEYLERRRRQAVAAQYRKAYSSKAVEEDELAGWEDEGVWPSE